MPFDFMLLGEKVPSTTLLSISLILTAIEPIAATIAEAGYIMKLGCLLGSPPILSDRSFDFL